MHYKKGETGFVLKFPKFKSYITGRETGGNCNDFILFSDQLSNSIDSDSEDSSNNIRKHRSRSNISYQQLTFLRHAYKSNPRPTRHIRRQISTQTGLDTKTVQIWFQNKRSKDRRRRLKGTNPHDSGLVSDIDDPSESLIGGQGHFSQQGKTSEL